LRITGDIKKIPGANVAVYSCPFDMLNTETKGTVLIKNAKELRDFSKDEENILESVRSSRLWFLFCDLSDA